MSNRLFNRLSEWAILKDDGELADKVQQLTGKVPDHSTISRNRIDRFAGTGVYQEIFDEIVLQAMRRKLIDGKTLYTDSTHLKANANKNKHEKKLVEKSTRTYLEELDADIEREREAHGKKPLKPKDEPLEKKEIKSSTTDPDSGYMHRDGKPKGFFYLDHRTVDSKHALITDAHVTPGNVHDSVPYLSRLDRQSERFGFDIKNVGVDAGYYTAAICKGLSERGIYGAMPYVRPMGQPGMFKKRNFVYDEYYDCYLCPAGQVLNYSTTNREGFHEYKSNSSVCCQCSRLNECTRSRNHVKVITRHVWEAHKEKVDDQRLTPSFGGVFHFPDSAGSRSWLVGFISHQIDDSKKVDQMGDQELPEAVETCF
jgi:hypothetical protein